MLLLHQVEFPVYLFIYVHVIYTQRRLYCNSLTSDIFRSFWLNVRSLLHYLANAMYGMSDQNMAIDGFWPIISAIL